MPRNSTSILAAFALALTIGTASAGDAPKNSAEDIREQISRLQEQLRKSEMTDLGKRRVTTIGTTRGRTRLGSLSIRIYDMGDLFAVAPPYPAGYSSDFIPTKGAVFSQPFAHTGSPTGSVGFGGQGGFGGGGQFGAAGGIGGGFFSTTDSPKKIPNTSGRQALRQLGVMEGGGNQNAMQTSLTSLIEAIKTTVSPELWQEEGGGSIAPLGTTMIVSADEDTHQQIDDMLNLFRKRWGTLRTISVQAWWLWLNDTELATLLENPTQPKPAGGIRAFGLVKDDAWKTIIDARQKAGGQKAGWRAAITSYNGQTVHTMSGGQSLLVHQVEPIVVRGEDGEPKGRVAYQPQVTIVQEGAALQVTPVSNVSAKTVLLDIHSRVSVRRDAGEGGRKEKMVQAVPDGDPRQITRAIDASQLMLHRISTTLRAPADRTMLVGGMTFESEPKPGEPSLYLFVRPTVQELRNDHEEENAKPVAPAQAEEAKAAE